MGLPVGEPSIIGTLGIPMVGVVGAGGVRVDGDGIAGELMLGGVVFDAVDPK